MSRPTPEITEPLTTAELGYYLKRSSKWVSAKCHSGEFETLPVGTPYLIPARECNRILKNDTNNRNATSDHRNAAR